MLKYKARGNTPLSFGKKGRILATYGESDMSELDRNGWPYNAGKRKRQAELEQARQTPRSQHKHKASHQTRICMKGKEKIRLGRHELERGIQIKKKPLLRAKKMCK